MSRRIAVAVSGGIDSLVAAHLLQADGWTILPLHFLTGFEAGAGPPEDEPARARARMAAIEKALGVAVRVVDARAEFRARVVDYFTAAYHSGETPNPCVVCNPRIKFGMLLEAATALGAERLATGHYARLEAGSDGRMRLKKGLDPQKDQSYFLCRLDQAKLRRACFPLGAMTKAGTRALAASRGLSPAAAAESRDVCFVKRGAYREFVAAASPQPPSPGLIAHVDGRILGEHAGLHAFTVGQRRGLNCPAASPYYVVRLDAAANRVIVGGREDLLAAACRVERINWIAETPAAPIRVEARIRYRHAAAAATFAPDGPGRGRLAFDASQPAVTPGQAAVFYRGDEVLGGGFIAA